MTPAMIRINGAIFGIDWNFSFHAYRKSAACERKPRFQMMNKVQRMNRPVSIKPGITPARNSRPIEVSVAMPYRKEVIDGGIRMPSVPPAQIDPVATSSGYPRRRISGIPILPMAAQQAGDEPVSAAKLAQAPMLEITSPPVTRYGQPSSAS